MHYGPEKSLQLVKDAAFQIIFSKHAVAYMHGFSMSSEIYPKHSSVSKYSNRFFLM